MKKYEHIIEQFNFLGKDFLSELKEHGIIISVEAKTELIREGQNVKFIPILLNGLVKVYSMNEDRELLYYYVKPKESCIMSFSSIFKDGISKIYACAEENSDVLLIPSPQILKWVIEYPQLNKFFFQEYELRYTAMMEMVNQAIFYKLDRRILDYLHKRVQITGKNPLKISHKEIANDVGTAREVVSRILKKFENEGVIKQASSSIEILQ